MFLELKMYLLKDMAINLDIVIIQGQILKNRSN